jgi:hypothetical protein
MLLLGGKLPKICGRKVFGQKWCFVKSIPGVQASSRVSFDLVWKALRFQCSTQGRDKIFEHCVTLESIYESVSAVIYG